MKLIPPKYEEPVTGFAGAGVGLFTGELASEFVVRTTGQTGYAKAGVKTVVKGFIGAIAFLWGGAATGNWALFGKVFGFTNWGSILLDWLFAFYPGGVFGMAERAAVTVRTWSMGGARVAAQLSTVTPSGVIKKTTVVTPSALGSY
ncbi:unnamed protein product [marine sediment metagenome]|uniref:Uncharacterized protein n=1 Tax=marine sediment metagenome TaxID=412755 RepID=X0ZM15_9ZZZZ